MSIQYLKLLIKCLSHSYSPCFFLQQYDIIYVEPKYKKKDREDKTLQYVTLFTSFVTTICSVIWAVNSTRK